MAQNYTEQLRKDNVRDAIYEDLQNNCEVLRTSWSGNAFPANPKVGQPCYRVDEDKLYYWDGYKWSQKGGGGSAELKTMELAAATSERVSITLEGARCLDKNMMFVFVDKIAQDPSTYSINDDGTVVNFNPAIPANAAVTLRWFDTDVGTFDTAIFASDAEFAAGELTNRAPNVKQVHSLSDMVASKLSGLDLMDVVFAPLGIDESKNKRRYLNGQVIIQSQFPAFTSAVKARMATMANAFTTEANWQAEKTNSKLGQCGKFVVDDTAGTIRLPCVVNAQGLVDLTMIGGIKSESLPNITGSWAGIYNNIGLSGAVSGNFSKSPTYPEAIPVNQTGVYGLFNIDASRSSSTYQNNAPVQQEAIQYPYCIVVNTGVEETDRPINNYQVNNVYSYGMSQYYKGTMNNNSWLKSAGQWNDGTVYTGMYNWLLEQRNAGIKPVYIWHLTVDTQVIPFITETDTLSVDTLLYGYSPNIKFGKITAISGNDVTIKNDLTNQTYTQSVDVTNSTAANVYIYDSSKMNAISKEEFDGWTIPINTSGYDFVINTENQTFRLPLLNGEEDLVGDRYDDLTLGESGTRYAAPANGYVAVGGPCSGYISLYNDTGKLISMVVPDKGNYQYARTFVPVSKGDVFGVDYADLTVEDFRFIYAQGNGSLYYYVGDTLQNAQLVNVARIEETVVTKTNKVQAAEASMPSNRYIDLTLGASGSTYTAPANGWFAFHCGSICDSRIVTKGGFFGNTALGKSGFANNNTVSVLKGEKVTLLYSTSIDASLRFYYCEGEG